MEVLFLSVVFVGLLIHKLTRDPDPARVRRILAQARITCISDTADGSHAVVRGTVALGDGRSLLSPLTTKRCVAWTVVFEEVGANDWVELGRAQDGVPFLLHSDAGNARVIPEAAILGVTPTVLDRPMPYELFVDGKVTSAPDRITALAHRVCRRPNHTTTKLRVTEYAVLLGATITVGGHVAREPDPDAAADVTGYRNALPTRPVLSGARRAPVLIA